MLIYKQRYKPRTSRAFTKSDLTVYDSAGNTALNALTVYGKSEVVNDKIVSAGEGWATVDLGTLTWTYREDLEPKQFRVAFPQAEWIYDPNALQPIICSGYKDLSYEDFLINDKCICRYWTSVNGLNVIDSTCTTLTQFQNKINGIILAYKQVTPTDNTIAIKTVNGSGIDGTMAVFSTGTPLRGIPETDVRDVMAWDGSAGTVTKKYNEVDLGTLTWYYSTEYALFTARITDMTTGIYSIPGNILCANYQTKSHQVLDRESTGIAISNNANVVIIKDPAYTDAITFQNAISGVKLVYELATPTTEQLTAAENASLAGLRTFEPQTHAQNNAQTDITVDYTIKVPTI